MAKADGSDGAAPQRGPSSGAFLNSQAHRQRVRAWMSILLALPMMGAADFDRELPRLWTAVANEGIPATRVYAEWAIVLGMVRFPSEAYTKSLLDRLGSVLSATTTSAISLLAIVMHVALGVEGAVLVPLYTGLFDRILPFSIHNNHLVRLFSIYVFQRLWHRARTHADLAPIAFCKGYENFVEYTTKSEYNRKFLEKVDREYFLSTLDAVQDYSIRTICAVLPRAGRIAEDECISPYSFINFDPAIGNVPFGNDAERAVPAIDPIRMGCDDSSSQEERSRASGEAAAGDPFAGFQQKINTWEMGVIDQDLSEIEKRRTITEARATFDVIVVASLIEKLPNLGGLSRTCEIFGATSLILSDARLVDDVAFKSVSMTSEKWLDISAVAPGALSAYLEEKKGAGYRIIALEQSSQSQSLASYDFPTKLCIVLGNESEGVPADILHVVDDCIEIPQFGRIRSLNVHVSASILLWEARKQRLLVADQR